MQHSPFSRQHERNGRNAYRAIYDTALARQALCTYHRFSDVAISEGYEEGHDVSRHDYAGADCCLPVAAFIAPATQLCASSGRRMPLTSSASRAGRASIGISAPIYARAAVALADSLAYEHAPQARNSCRRAPQDRLQDYRSLLFPLQAFPELTRIASVKRA